MRILLAVERFDKASGGQAIWARGFARFLVERGHDVHVAATRFDDELQGATPHRIRWSWSPLGRARDFNDVIQSVQPTIVHDSGVACWPGILHPQTGSNLVSLDQLIATEPLRRRIRAALSPKMILLRMHMRRLEREQARIALSVTAVSPLVASTLARRHRFISAKTQIVPNGVDLSFFKPTTQRLGDSGSALRVVAVAHNPMLKGVDTLLRAMARARGDGLLANLQVAGCAIDERWRRMVGELGLTGAVSFRGRIEDMRPFYQQADVFVHATRWDACSLATLEAMACGLPVITTKRNGASDAISDGISGFIMEKPEDHALIASLLKKLSVPAFRRAMGQAARDAVSKHEISENYARVEKMLNALGNMSRGAAQQQRDARDGALGSTL